MSKDFSMFDRLNLEDYAFGMSDLELSSLVESIKDSQKIVKRKQQLLNDFLGDYFIMGNALQYDENDVERHLITSAMPINVQKNKDTGSIAFVLDKYSILYSFCKSVGIDIYTFDDANTIEECYNVARKELKKVRSALKKRDLSDNSNTFIKNVSDDFNISTDANKSIRVQLSAQRMNQSKMNYYLDKAADGITTFLKDFRDFIDHYDVDIMPDLQKYIDSDKLALWIGCLFMKDYKNGKEKDMNNRDNVYYYNLSDSEHTDSSVYQSLIEFMIDLHDKYCEDNNFKNKKILLPNREGRKVFYSGEDFLNDYREFYQNYLFSGNQVDSEIVSKMTKNPPKNIFVGWEILPSGHLENKKNIKRFNRDEIRTMGGLRVKREDLEAKRQSLLDDKLKFFSSLSPVMTIKGINKLEGYYGFIFPNGKIILDKLYRNEEKQLPALEGAIYVLTVKNFIELSHHARHNLMNMIKDNLVEDSSRYYHDKRYKENVIHEINSNTNITKEDFDNMYSGLGGGQKTL